MKYIIFLMNLALTAGLLFNFSTSVSALPYGAGTYGACTYDTCGITLSSSGTVGLTAAPSSSAVYTIQPDAITVTTGASTGYTLSFEDSDAQPALVNGGNTIATSTGTYSAPITLIDNSWGYRIDSAGGFGAGPTSAVTNAASSTLTFAGIPPSGSAVTLKTTATAASSEITSVWYGVKATSSLTPGNYSTVVTYTAVTNP